MTEAPQPRTGVEPIQTPPARVYLDFYGLTEAPFTITPDPDFLYSSSCHRQVLDKIGYAIDGRMGFILLTGEVGTGKTTLCRTLLDRLRGRADTAYVINPSLSGLELLAGILEDTGAPPLPGASKKALVDRLHRRLLDADTQRPFVVIIDDAQTMSPAALEDLRLLSNLETDKRKLIQVVLSGQPELLDLLADKRLRQLKQRIAVHCRLKPLSNRETDGYIAQRLFVAGNTGQLHFARAAVRLVHHLSGGIPRLINKICDLSLTAGYVKDAPAIGALHVRRALVELDDLDFSTHRKNIRRLRHGLAIAAVLAAGTIGTLVFGFQATLPDGPDPIPTDAQGAVNPVRSASPPKSGAVASHLTSDPAKSLTPVMDREPAAGSPAEPITAETNRHADPTSNETNAAPLPKQASPAAFALQLGSFRTIEQARRGVGNYRAKGIPAHWQKMGDGQWVRVVAGPFETVQQARRYQASHALTDALIINAPLTVNGRPRRLDPSAAETRKILSESGHEGLMESGPSGDNEIHSWSDANPEPIA